VFEVADAHADHFRAAIMQFPIQIKQRRPTLLLLNPNAKHFSLTVGKAA
jgi:hypothetical protein